jgi:hypothetical protein
VGRRAKSGWRVGEVKRPGCHPRIATLILLPPTVILADAAGARARIEPALWREARWDPAGPCWRVPDEQPGEG